MTPRRFTEEEADYLEAAGFEVRIHGLAELPMGFPRLSKFIRQDGFNPGFVATVGNGSGRRDYESPPFDDPISAFVYAELNNWGQ